MTTSNVDIVTLPYRHEVPPTQSLSEGVIAAVSIVSGLEPVATDGISPDHVLDPLFTVIEPDALDTLFQGPTGDTDSSGQITFTYHGYTVTADSSGQITVTDAAGPQ